MKSRGILIFLGLAAQLDGYVLLQVRKKANQSDVDIDAVVHKRVTRGTEDPTSRHPGREDHFPGSPDNKVLAFGLDTGAPVASKNGIVQAITDAFGGLLDRRHVRSRGNSYKASDENKKPLSLEVTSEALFRSLEKFLESPKVKKIAKDLARKAAVVYRAIEKEL